jgi:archaellum component FlaF (FlaF/FlaG flagellin family)
VGYAGVGAAAIVLAAVTVAGYQATAALLDSMHTLQAAREASWALEERALRAAARVVAVDAAGGTVDIEVENSGSETLDASAVDVLLDGEPATVDAREVGGVATSVWPPLSTLHLTLTAPSPSDVVVATGAGALAFWRAA